VQVLDHRMLPANSLNPGAVVSSDPIRAASHRSPAERTGLPFAVSCRQSRSHSEPHPAQDPGIPARGPDSSWTGKIAGLRLTTSYEL
jgi:hypothetical protein